MASLPYHLLRGLSSAATAPPPQQQQQDSSHCWVARALREEEAAGRLQRGFRRRLLRLQQTNSSQSAAEERPRKRARKAPPPPKTAQPRAAASSGGSTAQQQQQPSQSQPSIPQSQQQPIPVSQHFSGNKHWLWRSLGAAAAPERGAAAELLLRYYHNSNAQHARFTLLEHYARFLEESLLPSMNGSAAATEACAVLQHLLLSAPSTNNSDAAATAATVMYWPWLCRQLLRESLTASSNRAAAAASLARVAARLVLDRPAAASDATTAQRRALHRHCLWRPHHNSSNPSELSPLACLLGAHFFGPCRGSKNNPDLRRLVDPAAAVATAATTATAPNSSSGALRRREPSRGRGGLSAAVELLAREAEASAAIDAALAASEQQQQQQPSDGHRNRWLDGGDDHGDDDDDDDGEHGVEVFFASQDSSQEAAPAAEGGAEAQQQQQQQVEDPAGGRDQEEEVILDLDRDDDDDDEDDDDDDHDDDEDDDDDDEDEHHRSHGGNEDDPMDVVMEDDDESNHNEDDDDVLIVSSSANSSSRPNNNSNDNNDSNNNPSLSKLLPERRRLYVAAAMQILSAVQHQQQQHHHHTHHGSSSSTTTTAVHTTTAGTKRPSSPPSHSHAMSTTTTMTAGTTSFNYNNNSLDHIAAEGELLKSVCRMVRPDQADRQQLLKSLQVVLRRAPTQEEFFRGALSRNPVPCSALGGGGDPTVADLRQHIANDLQMADSAELIEILLCNRILHSRLKLRVVQQVLWRNHLLEHGGSSGTTSIFASGSSIILQSGQPVRITADTPLTALPPMVATYRLAGVDGEATEDTVDALVDPEAPDDAAATAEEREARLEAQFGITRCLLAEGRHVAVLLRCVQNGVADALRRIRRDDVGDADGGNNPSRAGFRSSPPCPALVLLRHCAQLGGNRRLLLRARAPTVLLTLLLEVLQVLERGGGGAEPSSPPSSATNPTAEILQELIESLTSDMSHTATATTTATSNSTATATTESSADDCGGYESDGGGLAQDAASMPLLLQSIETIQLSPPLRSIIAKLLPFLTYGQADLSRELAQHFGTHIDVEALGRVCESGGESTRSRADIWMNTFVQTAISLPANSVCNALRSELVHCGLVERLATFIVKGMPPQPAPWSPALWQKGELAAVLDNSNNKNAAAVDSLALRKSGKAAAAAVHSSHRQRKAQLEEDWRKYYQRCGVRTAFQILTGLCRQHPPTQARIAMLADFLPSCHWLEGTSDSPTAGVETAGRLGLLAETLLDEMTEGNDAVGRLVQAARQTTKLRKKELAQERRNAMLSQMSTSNFRPAASIAGASQQPARSSFASILAPVVGLFQSSPSSSTAALNPTAAAAAASGGASSTAAAARPAGKRIARSSSGGKGKTDKAPEKPAWLAEAEMMEDETGLTCAVCQEGRTLQPSELLGMYCYVKKISIPLDHCGSRACIDGFNLLKALPTGLPPSLFGTSVEEWFITAKTTAETLSNSSLPTLTTSSGSGRRNSIFTTTVSAGTGIHHTCHRRARQADRSHPKAPKSEWEGAALRNNRVSCNVILPLVSNHCSKVPLAAVETALSEHTNSITNLLGVSPKSLLWSVLHDVRFLLLRMAYGESLSADCGGGSLASNCQLVFYQFLMADMFDKEAQADDPERSRHARGLASAILSGCAIVTAKDHHHSSSTLTRAIADAAPMAAITSLVFHNHHGDGLSSSAGGGDDRPHPKRQWLAGKEYFLQSLLICAGRRHAKGIEGSGCQTLRSGGGGGGSRQRSHSFADWNEDEMEVDETATDSTAAAAAQSGSGSGRNSNNKRGRSSSKPTVEDFRHALRPMIVYYAIMDALSSEFALTMNDEQIEESSQRMAAAISECQRARSIQELLRKAKVTISHDDIIELLQKGMVVAY